MVFKTKQEAYNIRSLSSYESRHCNVLFWPRDGLFERLDLMHETFCMLSSVAIVSG